jgi:hypothetical protein
MASRKPDFRIRYRIRKFFSLPLPPFTGGKIVSGPLPVYFLVRGLFSSGSVREAFGEASGVPEGFPKKSRRQPGRNPAGDFTRNGGQTAPKFPEKKFPYTVPNSEILFLGSPIFVRPVKNPNHQ